jgi:hypothetical protein
VALYRIGRTPSSGTRTSPVLSATTAKVCSTIALTLNAVCIVTTCAEDPRIHDQATDSPSILPFWDKTACRVKQTGLSCRVWIRAKSEGAQSCASTDLIQPEPSHGISRYARMTLIAVTGDDALARAAVRQLQELNAMVIGSGEDPDLRTARVIVFCAVAIGTREQAVFGSLIRRNPLAHFVIVTRITAESVRQLSAFPSMLRQVVGLEELSTNLRPCVSALVFEHYLDRAAIRLMELLNLPPAAKWFLQRTWRDAKPPTSVSEASHDIRVHLSTLRDNWPLDAPLNVLVEWALLGRAVTERRKGASWTRAALHVRVSKRRLERIAKRRLESDLDRLDVRGYEWVEQQFRIWLACLIRDANPSEMSA